MAPSRINCFCCNIVDIDIVVYINVFDEKFERLVMSGNRIYEIIYVKQKVLSERSEFSFCSQ